MNVSGFGSALSAQRIAFGKACQDAEEEIALIHLAPVAAHRGEHRRDELVFRQHFRRVRQLATGPVERGEDRGSRRAPTACSPPLARAGFRSSRPRSPRRPIAPARIVAATDSQRG